MQLGSYGLRTLQAYNDREHLETPYVAKLHRFTALAPTLPVFTFEHPNPAVETAAGPDNARETPLRFERPGAPAAVCHGFAGYFDAQVRRVPAPAQAIMRAQTRVAPGLLATLCRRRLARRAVGLDLNCCPGLLVDFDLENGCQLGGGALGLAAALHVASN